MITVSGRVVDEINQPVSGVFVVAIGEWLLTTERLTKPLEVDSGGRFTLEIKTIDAVTDIQPGTPVPTFNVRVVDALGRQLSVDIALSGTQATHDVTDIKIQRADAEGLLVTNRTGRAEFVSEGNAVKLLVDGLEAFGRIADDIEKAQHSIHLTQLFFALPTKFEKENEAPDPQAKPDEKEPIEKAALVFKFSSTDRKPIDPIQPPKVSNSPWVGDKRPERLILAAAVERKTAVRILMNEPVLGFPEGIFWLVVLSPLAAGLGAAGLVGIGALLGIGIAFFPVMWALMIYEFYKIGKILADSTDVEELQRYFGSALAQEAVKRITVRGFEQAAPDHGVLHCKMMIVDDERAVVLGSPFSQRYFDSQTHPIANPQRGSNTSDMVHDLSIAVVGPAVRDLFQTFRLYWNEDVGEPAKLPSLSDGLAPVAQASGEDANSRVQVVRTLSGKRFRQLGGISEKGILEGYLRAFGAAKHYIYLETQYFTDGVITEALEETLRTKPNVRLILVVPIKPDVPLYPRRQEKRIVQLRKAGGERVGVFTRWSYDENHPRPWVAPVYIHAKGAVVDDSWATIGSANLDGLSLDYNLLLSPLVFGETTACELNLNLLPATPGAVNPIAQLLRRRLFAEHLGILDADGAPNALDPALAPGPEHQWLEQLWRPRARLALEHVKNGARTALPGFVLEYPKEDGGCLDTPRKHLTALGVELESFNDARVRPITGTRKFHFSKGKWDPRPELEDIKR